MEHVKCPNFDLDKDAICEEEISRNQQYCEECGWEIDKKIFDPGSRMCNSVKDGVRCQNIIKKRFCPKCGSRSTSKKLLLLLIFLYQTKQMLSLSFEYTLWSKFTSCLIFFLIPSNIDLFYIHLVFNHTRRKVSFWKVFFSIQGSRPFRKD